MIYPFLQVVKKVSAAIKNRIPRSDANKQYGMDTYIGAKCIRAAPMRLSEYFKLLGFGELTDEDKEGYLVEYTDKEDGNVKGFNGYVSWSPKDVFEAAYVKIPVN